MPRHETDPEHANVAGVPAARSLPRWAIVADVAVLVLLGTALWVALTGGLVTYPFGVRVVLKSGTRPLVAAVLLLIVRHSLRRRPSLLSTVQRGAAWLRGIIRAGWAAIADVVPVFVGTRFTVLLVGLLAVLTIGYAPGHPQYRVSDDELANLPMRWDTGWYLRIALDGYDWDTSPDGESRVAFFPGYPMVVRAAGLFRLTAEREDVAVWVAVGVSLLAFLAALLYLRRLATVLTSEDTARHSAVLLSAYPFALFYSAAYTESVFLLGVLAAFYHQTRRQPVRAAAWGLFVGLTRPNGMLLSASLGLMALGDLWQWLSARHETREPLHRVVRSSLPGLVAAAAPAAGVLLYSAVVGSHTGDPFQWVTIQRIGWGKSAADFSLLWAHVSPLFELGPLGYLEQWPVDALNLAAVVFALASVWPVTLRLGVPYGIFVALTTLLPLSNGGLISIGRYTAVLFPSFIWLAMAVPGRWRPALVLAFGALQAFAATLFFTWRWLI